MVHIIDQKGRRAIVNAVSGDMFKHILVEHLVPLLQDAEQPLSPGANSSLFRRIACNEIRIHCLCEKDQEFVTTARSDALESEIMTRMLTECSLTDMAGALVTRGRSVGRKWSPSSDGWSAFPQILTASRSLRPNSISTSSTLPRVAGICRWRYRLRQAGDFSSSRLFRRLCPDLQPRSLSHQSQRHYAPICSGVAGRQKRATALIHALAATLLKPFRRTTQYSKSPYR